MFKSKHVECGVEDLKDMPTRLCCLANILAVSLRATRIKFAGIFDYALFVVRLEISALGVLRSAQCDMDYVLVNAHEV